MKERPIIFSTDMVLALLRRQKTQTRRLVKPGQAAKAPCQPGDVLYVRESFQPIQRMHDEEQQRERWQWFYKATPPAHETGRPWKPSIHMPQCAARLFLDVIDVRQEPLVQIWADDAIAEGIERRFGVDRELYYRDYMAMSKAPKFPFTSPIRSFQSLWDKIHGQGSWTADKLVWVIEFKVWGAAA